MAKKNVELDDKEVRKALQRLARKNPRMVRAVLDRWAETVIGIAEDKYLNAAPGDRRHLHSRTGRLSSSLRKWFAGNEKVYVGTNVKYAAIHEYGGVIRPRRAQYLRWKDRDGQWHMARKVRIPARPYLKTSIRDLFKSHRARNLAINTLRRDLRRHWK